MKAAADHEVEDEPEIVFQTNSDALANVTLLKHYMRQRPCLNNVGTSVLADTIMQWSGGLIAEFDRKKWDAAPSALDVDYSRVIADGFK